MYINGIGHYVPEQRVTNDYFEGINGLDADWILRRTGISSRSKISENEGVTSMAIEAVKIAKQELPYSIIDVDLIISAGYTITDSVGTVAHRVQREYEIEKSIAFAMTSACSSLINALEVVDTFFKAGKATQALIICSEANSIYNNVSDPQSGHLWGDGAVAMFLSKDRCCEKDPVVVDIATKGLGHIGKGPEGVCLNLNKEGLVMHDGRDVFMYACKYMVTTLEELLERNNKSISDLNYIATHQANLRIVSHLAEKWGLPEDKFFNTIQELGNTGSASALISISKNIDRVHEGDLVGITVFGGGYSSGAMLIRF